MNHPIRGRLDQLPIAASTSLVPRTSNRSLRTSTVIVANALASSYSQLARFSLCELTLTPVGLPLREDFVDDSAVHIGQTEIAAGVAESKAFVVHAELMQDGGV